MGEAALKGALAGAAGGVAMIAMQQAESLAGLAEDGRAAAPRAVGRAARAAKGAAQAQGVRMSGDQVALTGVAIQILAAAGIGAVYGVLSNQFRLPVGVQGSVLAGIVYAANLWGLMPSSGLLELPTGVPLKEALVPVGPHAVFGAATARAFDMLIRG